jgi:phosphoribosylaminoimidazolecarboxamide formyltransferase / IMP cyclohydrolase
MASPIEPISTDADPIEPARPGEVQVRRALLSVSEKSGLVEFARGLSQLDVELVSTGGTAQELSSAGLPTRAIEDFTGFPEIMDGRVKTLHPRLYAGLLARRDDQGHLAAAAELQIEPVDLVCVNLYPFERTVARVDASEQEVIENIDIGGPTMIRAAAKNMAFAAVVVDPGDYPAILAELAGSDGRLSLASREALARKAFAYTARYDAAISGWFQSRSDERFPPQRTIAYEKVMELRYGENPHQEAAFYREVGAPSHLLAGVHQLHGKELSFNNLLDLSSARGLAFELDEPACVIVKHNNPCGCALGEDALAAYRRAFACDPLSAFGGVIALNRRVDHSCAQALSEQFVEVLLAPGFDDDALELLQVKQGVRLLELSHAGVAAATPGRAIEAKPVIGGLLTQDRDAVIETREQMHPMGETTPTEEQWRDLLFAWRVCMHVRSNAIVIVSGAATIGVGAGQMSRVDAVKIAVEKAQAAQPELLAGSALASDAYFPFPDAPQVAIDAGVRAIIQPGGSVKDPEVLAAVERAGVAMVATGVRHFRH